MKPGTGESTAAITARGDDQAWPEIERRLREHATLVRMKWLQRYALQETDGATHGPTISATRVRKLEREGVLFYCGVDRYGLVETAHPRTQAVLGTAQAPSTMGARPTCEARIRVTRAEEA